MPNHCENDLHVTGPTADVDRFCALVGLDKTPPEIDYNTAIPYPAIWKQMDDEHRVFDALQKNPLPESEREVLEKAYVEKWGTEKDGFNSGGYSWCCDNWGTKWNAYDVELLRRELRPYREDVSVLKVSFQSAWAPPLPVIAKFAEMFPMLEIELLYFEQGCAYCGGVLHLTAEYAEDGGSLVRSWKADYNGHRGG